ncbi:MAG: GNAT family N-acetyltransferase [Clostridiaceae bacterium]|nr:GNAT family N-acetyltransferase [Clostridiaceae bacterium]
MFRFRRVAQPDKDRVLSISSKIWEGNDFIKYVFDDWVNDTEGEFTIGEKDGVAVGYAKYTKHSDAEAWLEGIRVDERYANQGFGKAITQYYISRAKAEGVETIRLSAYAESKESIKIVEGLGFKKDGYFTTGYKEIDKAAKEPSMSKTVINIMSTATAWDLITRGNTYYMTNGYISYGWTFRKASYELVDGLVKDKRVYGVLREGKVSSVMVLTEDSHKDGGLNIGFIDGDMASMKELVDFAEHQALKLGMAYFEIMAPMDERLINVLELSSFEFLSNRYKEVNVLVYNMKLIG